MKFFLFGIIPAFDLLANLIIFSSDINPSFDLNQVAEFSLILAISVIISAFVFGGIEQAIDHKSSIPTILIGRKEWVIIICLFFVILIASIVVYELDYLTKIISLACLLGFRGLGRAALYAENKISLEAMISAFELIILLTFLFMKMSIFESYIFSKTPGVLIRLKFLMNLKHCKLDRKNFIGYSISSGMPAIYLNAFYLFLPLLNVPNGIIVQFRYIQTLIFPIAFLGGLYARANIVFKSKLSNFGIFRHLSLHQTKSLPLSILVPIASVSIYVLIVIKALDLSMAIWLLLTCYCILFYFRAHSYSLLTINLGPIYRGSMSFFGVILMCLSAIFLNYLEYIGIIQLYLALLVIELILLVSTMILLVLRGGKHA